MNRQTCGPWIVLLASGAALGYFSQTNWALDNHEALSLGRGLAGAAGGAVLFCALGLGISRLADRWLKPEPVAFWRGIAAALGAVGLLWLIPGMPQTDNGLLLASVLLALAAGLLAVWLHPRLTPAFFLLLILLAASCVLMHDQQTHYYDRVNVERVLAGNADAPTRYRLLMPWMAWGLSGLGGGNILWTETAIRIFATFALFLVSARVLALWLKGPLIWSAALFQLILIPFSYYYRNSTDELEILGAWLLLWCVAAPVLRPWARQAAILLVILVFALSRETIILLVPWLCACGIARDGWGLKNPAWRGAAAMVAGVLVEQFLMVLAYGADFEPTDYVTGENLDILKRWFLFLGPERLWQNWNQGLGVLLSFAAGTWLVAWLVRRRLPTPLRLGVWINFPLLFLVQTFLGRYLETRQLYLLMPFVVAPLVILLAGQGDAQAGGVKLSDTRRESSAVRFQEKT